jgi:predicted tellurium resistance membrane protein TerC
MLLFGIAWVARLDEPFWKATLLGKEWALSWRDVVLIVGGLFLLAKSTYEIHEKLEGDDGEKSARSPPASSPLSPRSSSSTSSSPSIPSSPPSA